MWLGEIVFSMVCGFLLYLIYLASRCVFQVQEGHLGVLISFGKVLPTEPGSDQLKTFGPGLHVKWPWQCVRKVSMMEQMIDLSGEEGGTTAMASDGTMLRLDSKLRMTPQVDHLHHYLFSMERPVEHVKGLFTCLLRNEIANFDQKQSTAKAEIKEQPYLQAVRVGSYAAIRRERRLLNQHIQEFCRAQIGDRYGVRFDGVDLTDILPPEELAQSLNSVMNAQSEAQRLLAQTEAECEQRMLSARKGLAIARARGRAVEDEIGTMAGLLADLQRNGTLDLYIDRRRGEVLADSRISYIKRPS
jgi:regulator of protease activity HflC (stomatin/prohibitin superfamily)